MDSLPKKTDQTTSPASYEQENATNSLVEIASQAWADGSLVNPIGWYPSNIPVQPILELTNDKNVQPQETPATPASGAVRKSRADISPKPNYELHETNESVPPVSWPLDRENPKAASLHLGASRQAEGVNEPTAPASAAAKTKARRQSDEVNEPAAPASVLPKRRDGESAPTSLETKLIAGGDNKHNAAPTETPPRNNIQLDARVHRVVPAVPELAVPLPVPVPAQITAVLAVQPKIISNDSIGIVTAVTGLSLRNSQSVAVDSQNSGSPPRQNSLSPGKETSTESYSQPLINIVNDKKNILPEVLIKPDPVPSNPPNLSQNLTQILHTPVQNISESYNTKTHTAQLFPDSRPSAGQELDNRANRLAQPLVEMISLKPITANEPLGETPTHSPQSKLDEFLQSKNLAHLLKLNQKLDNLQLWNYQASASSAPNRDSTPEFQAKAAASWPSAKLEMSSLNSKLDDSSRPASKLESTVENVIRDLGCSLEDLKLTKLSEGSGDNTKQAVAKLSDLVAAAANPVSETANHAREQESSSLPSLVDRIADISIDLRSSFSEQAKSAIASNNPAIVLARQQILAEAVSLRDMISNYRSAEPVSLADLPGRNGPKFELNGPRELPDPTLTIQGGRSLDSQAKSDYLPLGRGLDGKFDPTASGAKAVDSLDGVKVGARVPDDVILPGDKNFIGDRKDLIDKKNDADKDKDNNIDKDLITLLTTASKIKDNKPEDKDEGSIRKEKRAENESRRKYIVRQGDTLESIAERIIGDRRFSLLLEIVNRGYIRYQWEGAVRKAILRVAQVIWLPSANEVKVHQTLFFTRKNKQNSGQHDSTQGAAALAPIDDSATEEIIGQALPQLELLDITASTKQINVNSAATTMTESPLSYFVSALRQAGGRDRIKLDFATSATEKDKGATSAGARSPHTPEQSWFEIQDLLNSMRIAVKAGRLPEESCSAIAAEALDLPVLAKADDKQIFKQLDSRNRIVLNMAESESALYLRQEKQVAGEWKTIACYEFRDGRSVRYLNKSNGSRRAFCMNLPESVVREMAVKDFSRNWQDYARDYDMVDLKTSK